MPTLKVYSSNYEQNNEFIMYKGNEYTTMKNDILEQNVFFEKGMMLRKVSDNKFFNMYETLECVGLNKGIAYFTSERLKSCHKSYHEKGDYPLAGIPLRHEESFELITEKDQKTKILECSLKRAKGSHAKAIEELKSNTESQKKLLEEQTKLEDDTSSFEELIRTIELKIENLN
jgi:hypothetical protein